MKVLYLITRPERGGAQMHVLDLISGLRQHCEIELACGDDEDRFLTEEAARLGVLCHRVPSLRQPIDPLHDARAFLEIRALLRRTRPDLVHAHTSKAGILGRLAAWMQGIPAIFTAHTWCFAEGTSWKWKMFGVPLERIAGSLSGPIINVSNANRDLALRFRIATPHRLITVHNGIPDEGWQGPERQTDPPTVIMVARFAPQKNQVMLLEAAAEIRAPFQLLFVGAGPTLDFVKNRACQLGLTDRTKFAGNRSDVPDLLGKSSIFALPTRWEGFPISTLEAMRAGLPVVASDVGGVREAVIDGENGFLTSPTDTGAFRRALELLLSDTRLRHRMAKKSRHLFEQRFTAERMLQKTFGVYRMAVPEGAAEYNLPVLETGEQA